MASAFPLDGFDYSKQSHSGIDFFSYQSTADVLAPHPDLFESELDSSLAGIDEVQLQLLTVDSHDAYSFLRSDTPTRGPPSAITESSRSSAYDSELYAPSYAHTQYSFPLDLEMDFQRIRVESDYADYQQSQQQQPQPLDAPLDFGSLPPTPPLSPPRTHAPPQKHFPRTAYSDYGPPTRSIPSYYNYIQSPVGTVSPNHVTAQLPSVHMPPRHEEGKQDHRKKYQCPSCPRAFARAYNLKTHMATHDPNRLKPHVCPHRACGRSFSRKHDLGRHIVSIHREDGAGSVASHASSSKQSIGVEQGKRVWCDVCGKGAIGRTPQCECASAQVK